MKFDVSFMRVAIIPGEVSPSGKSYFSCKAFSSIVLDISGAHKALYTAEQKIQ